VQYLVALFLCPHQSTSISQAFKKQASASAFGYLGNYSAGRSKMEKMKGRVLFIEEDADTCDLIATLLKYSGYKTIVAPTLTEGLRLARGQGFDLILLDWWFEDGTGVDLCRKIREFDGLTPVFFYTGIAYKPNLNQAIEAGAQGCFMRPTDIEDLLTAYEQKTVVDCSHSQS
jgi:CheY-like chemotaxis protein